MAQARPRAWTLGLTSRDVRTWLWASALLGVNLLYTRSSQAPPFWSHARVVSAAAAASAIRARPPPLLHIGGE
jgi:hypothetical protein